MRATCFHCRAGEVSNGGRNSASGQEKRMGFARARQVFSSIDLFAGRSTSPIGRGRRVAPGEGLRSLVRVAPPHPICYANRPLPAGERWIERAEGPIQSKL